MKKLLLTLIFCALCAPAESMFSWFTEYFSSSEKQRIQFRIFDNDESEDFLEIDFELSNPEETIEDLKIRLFIYVMNSRIDDILAPGYNPLCMTRNTVLKKLFSFSAGVEASDHIKFFINGEIVDNNTFVSIFNEIEYCEVRGIELVRWDEGLHEIAQVDAATIINQFKNALADSQGASPNEES